jgi:hypothetical protein
MTKRPQPGPRLRADEPSRPSGSGMVTEGAFPVLTGRPNLLRLARRCVHPRRVSRQHLGENDAGLEAVLRGPARYPRVPEDPVVTPHEQHPRTRWSPG